MESGDSRSCYGELDFLGIIEAGGWNTLEHVSRPPGQEHKDIVSEFCIGARIFPGGCVDEVTHNATKERW